MSCDFSVRISGQQKTQTNFFLSCKSEVAMLTQPVIRIGVRENHPEYVEKGDILLNQMVVDKQAGKVLYSTVEHYDNKYHDSRGRELRFVTEGVFRVYVHTPAIRKMSTAQPPVPPKNVGELREIWDERGSSKTWLRVIQEGEDIIAYEDVTNDTLHSYLCREIEGKLRIVAGRTRSTYWRKDGTPYHREFTMGRKSLTDMV